MHTRGSVCSLQRVPEEVVSRGFGPRDGQKAVHLARLEVCDNDSGPCDQDQLIVEFVAECEDGAKHSAECEV